MDVPAQNSLFLSSDYSASLALYSCSKLGGKPYLYSVHGYKM